MAKWVGDDTVKANMVLFGEKVKHAVKEVALFFQPKLENYAKENAPWTDRTANARQSLHAYVEELAGDIVKLYLSHGVSYGVHLETARGGKWAIVWSTIERYLPEIRKRLKEIFG